MGEAFVELGAEGINALTDKYWDTGYDYLSKKRAPPRVAELKEQVKGGLGFSSHHQQSNHKPHKHHNRLPSPEGDVDPRDKDFYSQSGRRRRESSIERESETSHRVRHEYRRERDDPVRKPESVLSKRDLNSIRDDRRDSRMSHANGYADRPRSQQPPRSRYGGYDDDDSDYDERTGKRYSARGRGYDDRDDDVPYDREVIETERYRGPARPYDRQDSYRTSRTHDQDGYGAGAGAVTQYRRTGEVAYDAQSRRSGRSRSRRRKSDRGRSPSDSRSRSRSRSRSKSGIRGKIDDTFDTSMQGLGAGIAGALVGGLAAKQFGNKKNNERDMIIGALVGGLGANAAENKWRDWKEEKERDQRYDSRDSYGRSKSAMR